MIIVIILIILIIAILYYVNRYMIKTVVIKVFEDKKEIKGLRTVENDDRILRLIKDPNTNMTELGYAFEKASMTFRSLYDLDGRHIGVTRQLRAKFKNMTNDLINRTKNMDIPPLLDDSKEDRDIVRDYRSHWYYYGQIYGLLWQGSCTYNDNNKDYEECYKEYIQDYKDKPLEQLYYKVSEILDKFDEAIDYADRRETDINYIKNLLNGLFP